MNLENRVEYADQTHQNHQAGGKKIEDEIEGIFQMKGADQVFYAKYKKKKREKKNQEHLPPPKA